MKKQKTALLVAGALIASALAGCGSTETAGQKGTETESVRLMVWSPSEDQSKESGEWIQNTCEDFAALHPEWDITFVYGIADEATAANQVAQDPEASADVFMYANDTLTIMTDANALAKFGGKYREEIEKTNSPEVLNSLVKDGDLYGVPFTTNTWFMYYDKSVFSEEDIKNLDTMLEKGVVSLPFTNSWYLPSFYIGNGCTLFGDGTQEELGVDFSGQKAVDVTNYLIDLVANPNFKIDADGSGIARWKYFCYFFRFLGCQCGKRSVGREYGSFGTSFLYTERRREADEGLCRLQGHWCESLQQKYGCSSGTGRVFRICRGADVSLSDAKCDSV